MTNAIEIRALRKSFGRTRALDGLDLSVRAGEVHAFLGPNGAGKTTTIRILLGLLRKDGGEATLLGGGEPAGAGDQQRDEDPGRHGRDPGRDQDRGEPLGVTEQRVLRPFPGTRTVRHAGATSPAGTRICYS